MLQCLHPYYTDSSQNQSAMNHLNLNSQKKERRKRKRKLQMTKSRNRRLGSFPRNELRHRPNKWNKKCEATCSVDTQLIGAPAPMQEPCTYDKPRLFSQN